MSQYYDLNNTGPQVQDRLDQTQENKQDIATLEGKVTAIENEIGESGQGGNTINARLDALETAVGSGGSVDERIAAAETEIIGGASSDYNTLGKVEGELEDTYRKNETYSKDQLDNLITTPNVEYVTVIATSGTTDVTTLLPATGAADTVYRVGNWDGTQYDTTMYALYAWNGSAYVCLAVRSFVGEVYDISANHPDGQGNPTPYADLAAALGTSGANIPADIRRGGMSIKFIKGTVQSVDNKYVQYRYMSTNITDSYIKVLSNWQKIDDIRFLSNDFQCFEKYKADGSDLFVPSSVYLCSSYYRAFIDLELYGFDKTVPHKLDYLSRNETASSIYRIIIYEYRNGSWSRIFDKSLNNVESNGNPNGINSVTWENSGKTVKALIDYSFIADNSGFTITPNASDPNFIIKKSCFKEQVIEKDYIEFDDLTLESVNLANPSNIQLDKEVRYNGRVYSENGYAIIGIAVSAGQVISFGGFKLGRSGYYTVQDSSGEPITSSYGVFTDPNGTASPLTLTMPTGAAMLYFDIKTSLSPANPYAELMVNIGNSLMPYQPYEEKVTEIRDYPLAGDSISRQEIVEIENDIQELQDAIFDTSGLIADLPVSADGTGIDVGHAYINSSTGVVTVKLS